MSKITIRTDAKRCFVCGPENPRGLQIRFHLDGDSCRGEFTPNDDHVGFDGVTHGGILFSVLDDVMANWLFLQGARATTARSEIRFRSAHPPGATLLLEAQVAKRKGALVVMQSRAVNADTKTVIAEAEARYMVAEWGNLSAN